MNQLDKFVFGFLGTGMFVSVAYLVAIICYALTKDPVFGAKLLASVLAFPLVGWIVGNIIFWGK